MKAFHSVVKKPGEDPIDRRIIPSMKGIADAVGGPFYSVRIQLRSGRHIAVFYNQFQAKLDYNFTIDPNGDPKYYIDINGTAIVYGTAGENLTHVELTPDERAELFRNPYEE